MSTFSQDDAKRLASLMETHQAGANNKGEKLPLLNRTRIAVYGTALALVGAVVGNGIRGASAKAEALQKLRESTPYSSPDPAKAVGLEEIISVRHRQTVPFNTNVSREYLSALLEKGASQDSVGVQGEYRGHGTYQENPRIKILQLLVMGQEEADGFFGEKTARAFRRSLQDAAAMGLGHDKLPSANESLNITVNMAKTLIAYSLLKNPEARRELQKGLLTSEYNIGESGADTRIGPQTKKALDAFRQDRAIEREELSAVVAGVLEGRKDYRESFLSDHILQRHWYGELNSQHQQELRDILTKIPKNDLAVFQLILDSPGFTSLTAEAVHRWGVTSEKDSARALDLRWKTIQIFNATDFEGRCHLLNLCHRHDPATNKPTILETTGDPEGADHLMVVADYIHRLVGDTFRPGDNEIRPRIISGCLAELDPYNINQGNWGRCAGDVVQYSIFLRYPALAAKIAARSFSIPFAKEDSQSGPKAIGQSDGYDPHGKISPVEARIQAWLMELGDEHLRYDSDRDCLVDGHSGERKGQGLTSHEVAKLLNDLTGEEHKCYSTSDEVSPEALILLLRKAQNGDCFSYSSRYMTPSEVAELSEEERRGRTQIRFGHIVNFVSYDEEAGEVHFRTWGRSPIENGVLIPSSQGSLERRVVDQDRGIYAVSLHTLGDAITGVILRSGHGVPDPKDIDNPWQFSDILTKW